MITDGTGSFGLTLERDILVGGVAGDQNLSRDEVKQEGTRRRLTDDRVRFHLGYIRDCESTDVAMTYINHAFRAADIKQVPSCEFFPHNSISTSVCGFDYVIRSAAAKGVKLGICLATDGPDNVLSAVPCVTRDIRVIGTRHGEKFYESLLTSEEMAKAEEMGDYYRVPLDARSMDYGLYTTDGEAELDSAQDYNSHQTTRLGVDEVVALLGALPQMQAVLVEVRA